MSTAPNPSTALARVVADELARSGVRHAIVAPGSRSTALALALDRREGLAVHVEIDERSAAFLALGIARGGAGPAAVVSTSGTAATGFHPAVVEADADRVPLVVLTADRPPELRDTGANQAIDQLKLFGDAVRWFCEVGAPTDRPGANAHWRSTISRAVATARGAVGPAGPVHLNLPFREPTVPVRDDGRTRAPTAFTHDLTGRDGGRPWTRVTRTVARPSSDQILALGRRMARVERGLLLAGRTDADPEQILGLAAASGWPLIAEPLSGARRGHHAVATAHHLVGEPDFAAENRPDLVLRIGRPVLSRAVTAWLDAGVEQILLDPDGAWLDPGRAVSEVIVADVGETCRALREHLGASASSRWLDRWRSADRSAGVAVAGMLDAADEPTEPATARDVAAAVPAGGVLVAASSMPVRDVDRFMERRSGLTVVGNRGASGIDGFVSMTLGVALVHDGPTVALAGDLSLLHDANGFLLRPDGPVPDCVFVVVNNDGGGIFHLLPQVDEPGFERLFATPHGRDPARLAALHDLEHTLVERADRLGDAVTAAIAGGGLHLVEVRTDRERNAELRRRIRAAVGAAIS